MLRRLASRFSRAFSSTKTTERGVRDWSAAGGLEKSIKGESQADYETPGRLLDKADELGREQGSVRTDSSIALAGDNGAHGFIDGAVGVRKYVRERHLLREAAPQQAQAAAAPGRAKGEAARSQRIRERIRDLKNDDLPQALARLQGARADVSAATRALMDKPRHLQGYFPNYAPVGFAGGAVVCFDAFVLHGALKSSGLDIVSVWGTTATVAMAIAAANHAFGVLAGAIGLAFPQHRRLALALTLFFAGMTAMISSFVLLMIFRADAIHAANAALASIAEGKIPRDFTLLISPLWMGPLQVGGSLAAITLTAFWTMAKEGRDHTEKVIAPAEAVAGEAAAEVQRVRGEIAGAEDALEQAIVDEHAIEARGKAARADYESAMKILTSAKAGEDSLGTAAKGRYKSAYHHHDTLYGNAGLWQMATPSVLGWFTRRWRNRGPAVRGAAEATVASRRAYRWAGARKRQRTRIAEPEIAGSPGNGDDPTHG